MQTLRVTRGPLLIATMLLALLLSSGAEAAAPPYQVQERKFLELINGSRTSRGLAKLAASPKVDTVARNWSKRMAADGTLRHNPNVSAQLPIRWTRWGENVGWASNNGGGSLTSVTQRLHRGFMDSPGHRANILGAYNQVGIGVAVDARGTMWATMVFVQGTRPSTARAPIGLTDIGGSPHRAAIMTAWKRGLISSCDGEQRFCPNRNATRATAARAVAEMLDLPSSSRRHFSDVRGTHAGAINALADAGIVVGCAETRFCPNAPLSRAQLASLLERALDDLAPLAGTQFTDLPADYVHTPAINALAEAGITRGCAIDRFCPTARVTRAQLAAFVVRALHL